MKIQVHPFRLVIALVWTAVCLWLLLSPSTALPDQVFKINDKLAHFILFFGIGFTWVWTFNKNRLVEAIEAFTIGLILAVVTEVGQGMFPEFGRQGSLDDFWVNLAGIIIAIVVYTPFNKKKD